MNFRAEQGHMGGMTAFPPRPAHQDHETREMKFGRKLKLLAKARNVSQDKLAVLIGKSQTSISNYMVDEDSDQSISLRSALLLARHLGVSLDYLADPDTDARDEESLALERDVRRLIDRMGLERAYLRLTKIDEEPRPVAPPKGGDPYGQAPGMRQGPGNPPGDGSNPAPKGNKRRRSSS